MKYQFTKSFLITGLLLGLLLFFKSSTLIAYIILTVILTLVVGSIGWAVGRLKEGKYKTPLILLVSYLAIGSIILYESTQPSIHQPMVVDEYQENIFTGECRWFVSPNKPAKSPWYWGKSRRCANKILKERCKNMTSKALRKYNNSCEVYIEEKIGGRVY